MASAHTVSRCSHSCAREEPRRVRSSGNQKQCRAMSHHAGPPAFLRSVLMGCALDCADSTSHHTSRLPTPTRSLPYHRPHKGSCHPHSSPPEPSSDSHHQPRHLSTRMDNDGHRNWPWCHRARCSRGTDVHQCRGRLFPTRLRWAGACQPRCSTLWHRASSPARLDVPPTRQCYCPAHAGHAR